MRPNRPFPVALTIAGSDSGGGAGLQADLAAFRSFGVWGTSAVTCLTAQNPRRVAGILPVTPAMVSLQIRTVCEGFSVAAAKTGMLFSADIIRAVARSAEAHGLSPLVVDPVMIATSGARLLRRDAVKVLIERLFPLAAVITPNLPEAEVLWGRRIASRADMHAAAAGLGERFGVVCVVKGGHLRERGQKSEISRLRSEATPCQGGQPRRNRAEKGFRVQGSGKRRSIGGALSPLNPDTLNPAPFSVPSAVVDVVYAEGVTHEFRVQRVETGRTGTHGTGCRFSAALTACLARGLDVRTAVRRAQRFVAESLRDSPVTEG